jgi:hypothetical protein
VRPVSDSNFEQENEEEKKKKKKQNIMAESQW